jgi:multidrug efflux pump subunit AcrA (membrane-fusion protein)
MYANRVVIEEGLNEGDQLIVRGQQLVETGNRVRVVNEAEFEAG